ncbi:hypothetical protein CVT24_002407 [Panaeolus cyanescens]|uniref:Uncharacterized protein n=1 Tax=Panaeolus cyanescens TaxID=181874 RepID=A0A409W0V7_9AGAR|nr:hypothetical protein CVT24_002407 [Panaeolus cyanescens]
MSNNNNDNATPRASNLSTSSAVVSPSWKPPKSPLPPHRLAKLANALGISTPIPSHNASFLSRSFSESAGSIDARRSPTPSAASSAAFSSYPPPPSTSKYLLHVVPPNHLPHDSPHTDTSKTPPPPNTPGYHAHFCRGTLVPVHSTLQAQLGAIAKEYALPSTAGLVLYLISSSPSSQTSPGYDPSASIDEEPGPRLSEDIWRHLWTRVLRTEQRDDLLMPPTSPASLAPRSPLQRLGNLGSAARSTPFLPQEGMAGASLRPFIASPGPEPLVPYSPRPQYHPNSPITPTNPTSPSTPSTISDGQYNNKSAPPSTTDDHEPATPDTSVDVDDSGRMAMLRDDSLDLPGLNSPSLIPILAKVEFDVDRRKAAWYEPWLRSRKANHMKRDEHKKRLVKERDDTDASAELSATTSEDGDPAEKMVKGKKEVPVPPIELITGNKDKKLELPPLSPTDAELSEKEKKGPDGYARLSESPAEMTDAGEDEDDEDMEDMEIGEEATAIVGKVGSSDPLKEVFGEDEQAWAELHAENADKRRNEDNPNIVPLALTAGEVAELPDQSALERSPHDFTREEDEVREMLDIMGQPELALQIPSPDKRNAGNNGLAARSKVPPPLMFKPKGAASVIPVALTPTSGTGDNNAGLAYLESSSGDDDEMRDTSNGGDDTEDLRSFRVRSPESSEKRTGAVFDDLDLGLDPSEDFDDDDPNDRRRSQLLMKAQLDAIERTMAQLSPRFMTTDLAEDPNNYSFTSATLSPSSPQKLTLSPGPHLRNSDVFPASPRLPHHPDPPEESPTRETSGQAWPAVPFSMIKERGDGTGSSVATGPDAPPSPPRLAVNGVTTSAPKSYLPTASPGLGISAETEKRRKEQEEEEALYPPVSAGLRDENASTGSGSPVIPLSPDPFGRYPSGEAEDAARTTNWETMTIGRGVAEAEETVGDMSFSSPRTRARSGTTSRFSADSFTTEEVASSAASTNSKASSRATLMSVKSFKKLWRKSNNKSTSEKPPMPPTPPPPPASAPAVPTPLTASGRASPMVPPQRPERPSEEQLLDIPDVPLPPPPPSAGLGRLSPGPNAQAPPHPPGRMSIDQQSVRSRPSVDGYPQQHRGQPTPPPPSAGLGRLSPGPNAQVPPQYPNGRTSIDQMSVRSRPSVDGYPQPPPPIPPNHSQYNHPQQMQRPPQPPHPQQMQRPPQPPHPQQMQRPLQPPYPQQHPQHPQGFYPPHPPHPQPGPPGPPGQFNGPGHHPQLSVGSFQGRNPNPPPIVMTHLQPSRSATGLDRLHFDQESPYPTSFRPARQSPRPPSPTPLPIIPEGEKNYNNPALNMNGGNNYPASANAGTRKSILKKNGVNGSSISSMNSLDPQHQIPASAPPSRTSFERPPSANGSRGRRPSVINFGSTRSSATSPELPPSPPVPNHLVNVKSHPPSSGGLDYRTSQRSKLTTSSSDSWSPPQRQASLSARSASPPRSMASSRDSGETRPSFDVSQFEFVSPPRGVALSYPYNTSFDSQQ